MPKFLIGADPEFFIKNKYGSYKSAVGLIGGSKEKPLAIDKDGHAILEDNVAVEFNIKPAEDVSAFRSSIHKVLDYLREKLPGYEFSKESAVSFPFEELCTPEAQMFGCEPDYDAWSETINQKPQADDPNLRSAGGHIHVGSDIAKSDPVAVIRAMDLFLGVPSVVMDEGSLRRNLYGKPGSFRFKPYGCEYRTLSNFWIFDDSLIAWAYSGTQRALDFVSSGQKINEELGSAIQDCINNNNIGLANNLIKHYKLTA
jgi:hypothetical protein